MRGAIVRGVTNKGQLSNGWSYDRRPSDDRSGRATRVDAGSRATREVEQHGWLSDGRSKLVVERRAVDQRLVDRAEATEAAAEETAAEEAAEASNMEGPRA